MATKFILVEESNFLSSCDKSYMCLARMMIQCCSCCNQLCRKCKNGM